MLPTLLAGPSDLTLLDATVVVPDGSFVVMGLSNHYQDLGTPSLTLRPSRCIPKDTACCDGGWITLSRPLKTGTSNMLRRVLHFWPTVLPRQVNYPEKLMSSEKLIVSDRCIDEWAACCASDQVECGIGCIPSGAHCCEDTYFCYEDDDCCNGGSVTNLFTIVWRPRLTNNSSPGTYILRRR